MSPRAADPNQRVALIEAAAQIISEHGSDALTLRRVARDVGTSTMAIYTHFGSMEALERAVRVEAFQRLYDRVAQVPLTDDPIHDLAEAGRAYVNNALANPNLYRVMFMTGPPTAEEDSVAGQRAFDQLVAAVQRCISAGVIGGEAELIASQLWVLNHGAVSLVLAEMMDIDRARVVMVDAGAHLLASLHTPSAT